MAVLYDTIGKGYATRRQPDPRIAAAIHAALGDAGTVLNVGAGAGSYEPAGRVVTALEPSAEMIGQRPEGAAPAVQGVAEALPFEDDSFDAAMASLTVHHWSDVEAGLHEMKRVARQRVVIFTFDPASSYFWLTDYIPEMIAVDTPAMPALDVYGRIFGEMRIDVILIPHDCTDGFLGAYWRRPHAYLDASVRAAISTFAKLGDVSGSLTRLEADLASGAWQARYGDLMKQDSLDIGYRLVTAEL